MTPRYNLRPRSRASALSSDGPGAQSARGGLTPSPVKRLAAGEEVVGGASKHLHGEVGDESSVSSVASSRGGSPSPQLRATTGSCISRRATPARAPVNDSVLRSMLSAITKIESRLANTEGWLQRMDNV